MKTLKNKKILLTGGAGFIGRNFIDELLKQGALLTIIDLPDANYSGISKKVEIIKVDVLDKRKLANMTFGQYDYIFHLAARTDLDGKTLHDYRVNFDGTKNIIELAKKVKAKKFVLYSTQLVVGLFNETRFIGENEPYKTKTIYGESKIKAEKVTIQMCKKHKLPYIIIRPTSVYGPRGGSPYKEFFKQVKSGIYFHIGKGDNLVSMVYVENLINETIVLTLNDKANNRIFYGNDLYPYTMRQVVDEVTGYYGRKIITLPKWFVFISAYLLGIFKYLGIDVPFYPFRYKNMVMNYCYNIQGALSLGYQPKYTLSSGIIKTLGWYEKNSKS